MREEMNSSLADCGAARLINTTLYLKREQYSNTTRFSKDHPAPLLREWIFLPTSWEANLFIIPTVSCLFAALLIIPAILFVICTNLSLRQETRYQLLGNALLSDLAYLVFYGLSALFNVLNLRLPDYGCVLLLFLLAVTYCGGVLTAAAMVLDTYLAVLWPLRYVSIVPPSRTKKLIVILWISSCFFPAVIFVVLYLTRKATPCPFEMCSLPVILIITLHGDDTIKFCYILFVASFLLCISLILCCYALLCFKTRESGIWKGVSSRASITFLMHHTILFFYFCPLLLLITETLLYINSIIGLRTGLWVTLTICNVLIVLPKALFPYLYGLRYREISNSVCLLFRWKRPSLVAPITA
ncbi:probable G-protein coupled receptor 148 [Ambystoma mexicanum]|uniref:probable G-protein coupled receptor 148 n=1 Tax=Ambystoma mexicanum TaxID=8296 RepID=UPI0037E7080E